MKQNRTIILLIATFLGLVGIIALNTYSSQKSDKDEYVASFGDLSSDEIVELELATPSASLKLKRANNVWEVDEYRAKFIDVEELINGLIDPVDVRLASENDAKHDALGVASSSAIAIKLNSGDKTFNWLVGNSDKGGQYVRQMDEVKVFWIEGLNVSPNSNDLNSWLDLTIARIPESAIEKIEISHDENHTLLQSEEGWVKEGEEDIVLDSNGFQSLLNTLVSFEADSMNTEYSLPDPIMEIAIHQKEGESVVLNFYSTENGIAWVTSSEIAGIFEVPESIVDDFRLSEVDLIPKTE